MNTTESFMFREYRPSDHSAVMALHRRAMEAAGAWKGEGPWDADLDAIEKHYSRNGGIFLVAEIDGVLAAMGAIRRIDSATAEVKRMRTQPDLQGKGIGRKLLEELILRAVSGGYKRLILETSVGQSAARRLYESVGFKEFSRETIDGFDCIWYELKLPVLSLHSSAAE